MEIEKEKSNDGFDSLKINSVKDLQRTASEYIKEKINDVNKHIGNESTKIEVVPKSKYAWDSPVFASYYPEQDKFEVNLLPVEFITSNMWISLDNKKVPIQLAYAVNVGGFEQSFRKEIEFSKIYVNNRNWLLNFKAWAFGISIHETAHRMQIKMSYDDKNSGLFVSYSLFDKEVFPVLTKIIGESNIYWLYNRVLANEKNLDFEKMKNSKDGLIYLSSGENIEDLKYEVDAFTREFISQVLYASGFEEKEISKIVALKPSEVVSYLKKLAERFETKAIEASTTKAIEIKKYARD